jgi:AcrR family transcriptional regulator
VTEEDAAAKDRPATGRPRSKAAHRAILDAVIALIGEATIYRRWANKDEMLLEALGATFRPLPCLAGRSVREDLLAVLSAIADPEKSYLPQVFNARCYVALLVEGERDPDFMRRYRREIIEPRQRMFHKLVERAKADGQLRPDLDPEVLREMLVTPVIQRLIRMQPGDGFPEGFIEKLVDTALEGARAR